MQTTLNFTSPSPINSDKLTGQNKRLFDYLASGKSIHCMHPDRIALRIGYMNSRISDIVKAGYEIGKRYIKVKGFDGEETTVVEYTLKNY